MLAELPDESAALRFENVVRARIAGGARQGEHARTARGDTTQMFEQVGNSLELLARLPWPGSIVL
jgi:hypothetical protein